MRLLFISFSVLLLAYMLWPGAERISDFAPLPSSVKSNLEGDTIQVSNVSAYFSDNFREFVIPFYFNNFQDLSRLPFPPLRINRPPEYSWQVIKKHTDSTYLEEFVYPLRDSIYVNGYEPFYSDGEPKFWGSIKFEMPEGAFFTKVTLRYFPSTILSRILVWFGIIASLYWLYKLGRKIFFKL